jgi:hypothetical protein
MTSQTNTNNFWRVPLSIAKQTKQDRHSNNSTRKSKKHSQSRWNKYIHKLHTFIVDELDGFCLVEKNNVMRRYKTPLREEKQKNGDTMYSQFQYVFECRFQGDKERCYCNARLTYIQKREVKDEPKNYYFTYTIFDIQEKTPSKLYRKTVVEFDTCPEFNFYEYNGFTYDYLRT